jgi:hypothetical protein
MSIQLLLLADAVEQSARTHNTTARAARTSDLFMTYLFGIKWGTTAPPVVVQINNASIQQ